MAVERLERVVNEKNVVAGWDDAQIAIRSLETGEQRVVFRGGTRPRYASTGHLLVERAGSILAVPFDLKTLLREGATDEALSGALRGIWQHRADRYSEIRTNETARERKVEMSFIGG